MGDLKAFAKAYAWSTVAALPVFVHTFEGFFWVAYLSAVFLGAITIVVVAIATAILDSHIYKFMIYVAAVSFFFSEFWFPARDPTAGAMNGSRLIFVQVVFGLGLFYFIAERSRIAGRIAKILNEDQAKMIAEERETLDASRHTDR